MGLIEFIFEIVRISTTFAHTRLSHSFILLGLANDMHAGDEHRYHRKQPDLRVLTSGFTFNAIYHFFCQRVSFKSESAAFSSQSHFTLKSWIEVGMRRSCQVLALYFNCPQP